MPIIPSSQPGKLVNNHSSLVIPNWVNGKPAYALVAIPESIDFSNSIVGVSRTKKVTILNVGFKPIKLSSVVITSTVGGNAVTSDAPQYVVNLLPGYALEVNLTYLPDVSASEYEGQLTVTPLAGHDPVVVPIIGSTKWNHVQDVDDMLTGLWEFLQRATLPAIVGGSPLVSVGNSSIVFDNAVAVGGESSVVTVAITNSGGSPLIISDIAVTGDFEVQI